jgi:hypothetical protein
MLVVTERYGQLSNRLYALTPFIGFAIQQKIRLVCFSFGEYQSRYPNINTHPQLSFIQLPMRILKPLRLAQTASSSAFPNGFWRLVSFSDEGNNHKVLSVSELTNPLCFLDPWHHPKYSLSDNEASIVRRIFTVDDEIRSAVSRFIASHEGLFKKKFIAIHVRRGDYQYYNNGKWFYSNQDYNNIVTKSMLALRERYGRDFAVVVCSNDPTVYLDGCIRSPFDDPFCDQELLSRASFIIGPPSTYSHWASFMGNTKICSVTNPSDNIGINDFKDAPPFSVPYIVK